MYSYDSNGFCSLETNSSSFYCKTVELVGPLPQEYQFFYGIVYFLVVVIMVSLPLIICKILTGGSK